MFFWHKYIICFLLIVCVTGCSTFSSDTKLLEPGVSLELAKFRKKNYERVRYNLFFSIPEAKADPIAGEIDVSFLLRKKQPVIIDFRADDTKVLFVKVNGKNVPYKIIHEHIFVGSESILAGENTIQVAFTPEDQSLNRRDEYLYTLLVPDRARTLFPCFDQPDMKALFSLEMEIPASWQAVSNSVVLNTDSLSEQNRKIVTFKETEPLSTYLFSFVAGKLERIPFRRNGREIAVYHRETDPKRIDQCPEIARQVFEALEWLESYTDIPYPFAKYDLIILPGFQYGGMEHTGATLYNDRRMFLNNQPTLNEELSRSSLIAHETAHMWFGDYVTMEWFDDVWTKEVFANYFASKIVEPLFPEINHDINFMLSYFPSSYLEDRTAGSNPIKQPLTNLRNAGLVYGNIIYNKSPIVLDMLVRKMGEDSFRKGIREYLKMYAYGNATWEKLIDILDKYTDEDLKAWSYIWVNEKGMPTIQASLLADSVVYRQSDPWERGLFWPQGITSYRVGDVVIPNKDGKAYGFFRLNSEQAQKCVHVLQTSDDEVFRASVLLSLYENLLNQTIAPEWYMDRMLTYLPHESNPLLFSMLLGNIANGSRVYPSESLSLEQVLWKIASEDTLPQRCLQSLRTYCSVAESPEAVQHVYMIWKKQKTLANCTLSETDYMNLSYLLALRLPEQADDIINEQLMRISNPDRKQEYRFISPAVSPIKEVRDSVFHSLMHAENRRVEPWAASALSYLNHKTRRQEAVGYIRPALDILQDIQRTGDIFFPTSWVRSLLSGHTSAEAKAEVDKFFADNPDYPEMLSNKIKQQADFLYRANKKESNN